MFARDPGGANAIAPIAKELINLDFNVEIYGLQFANDVFLNYGIKSKNIQNELSSIDRLEIKKWLSDKSPQIVITGTSADDFTEQIIWSESESLGIKSIAVLDQWMNYGIRFSKYSMDELNLYNKEKSIDNVPDIIVVMDDKAKSDMVLEGFEEKRIRVIGNPYFDYIKTYIKPQLENGTVDSRKTILYCSEPISEIYDCSTGSSPFGFDEISTLKHIVSTLNVIASKQNMDINLIIRPHPKDRKGKYDEFLTEDDSALMDVSIDKYKSTFDSIMHSQIILGMQSMVLLEAVLLEKPIISVQIGLKKKNIFILDEIGVSKSVYSIEELEDRLNYFLQSDGDLSVKWDANSGSISKFITMLEEML